MIAPAHKFERAARNSAQQAGLRYSSDAHPGIRRLHAPGGFAYRDPGGKLVRDPESLARIKRLAIPPAWTEVWICPDPNGHLQATGRDARGRKQYRYHPHWREVRDETKYNRMIAFGRALPKIRRRVRQDIRQRGLGRQRVLAAIVRLLELSSIRVGNDEYAQQNRSYGLTTLQDRHARVAGRRIHFRFRGKSGKEHELDVEHPVVARVVKKCQDLPGQDLFQYLDDDGVPRDVTSGDVNDYLREITGADFTAKDFRTWTGTVLAALALRDFEPAETQRRLKRNMVRAIERVAQRLGNTPTVCKKCYIHPVILDSYLDGTLASALQIQAQEELTTKVSKLRPEEAAVVALLRLKLKAAAAPLREQLHRSLAARKGPER